MEYDTIVSGGVIVSPSESYRADIGIMGEKIAALGAPGSLDGRSVIDADGGLVLPGLIDPHTHLDLPWVMGDSAEGEVRSADDYRTGTAAAAAGGVTTVLDFAMTRPGQQAQHAVQEWKQRAAPAIIDHGLHVILTDWSTDVMEGLGDLRSEGVATAKVFMPYAIGASDEQILETLDVMKGIGGLTLMHCEAACSINWLVAREALSPSTTAAHYRSRPDVSEADGVARAGRMAEVVETGYYNVHMSSEVALEEIERTQARGVPAIGETCPHYLSLDVSLMDQPDGEGDKYTCTPPLRSEKDRDALWAGLKRGVLSTVGSDHAPWRLDQHKSLGRDDFRRLPHGLPTLQTMLPVLYTYGVKAGRISENQLVAVSSANAARIFGLKDKGAIAVGHDADLVLIHPERTKVVDFRRLEHAMDYSPWDGESLAGWPSLTVSRGAIVYDGERVSGEPGRGRFVASEGRIGA